MLAHLAAGLFFLAVLVAVSARVSPEWGKFPRIAHPGPPEPGLAGNHSGILALALFGIVAGVPAALGLVPGNVLTVLGGMVATMTARRVLLSAGAGGDPPPSPQNPSTEPASKARYSPSCWLWFVPFAWSVLAAAFSAGTLDLRGAMATQAVFGPAALAPGPALSALLTLAFGAGLVSAVFWARQTPSVAGVAGSTADAVLRWGEAALAGAAVSAAFFGPSVGGLLFGPPTEDLRRGMAGSFLLTCMVVGLVSGARRRPALPLPRLMAGVSAGLALVALGGAVFVR